MIIEGNVESNSRKRIGIATFIESINYGALLQAYALGKVISSNGYDVYYVVGKEGKQIATYHGMKKLFYELVAKRRFWAKENSFEIFREKYFTRVDNTEIIDTLVCGSDQVWNIQITNGYNPIFWGEACNQSIGYAISCGELKPLMETIEICSEKVKKFSNISVRENDLAKFISEICGKECPVVCDPSLLLISNDYEKISNPLRLIKEDYVLIYQMSKNSLLYSVANKIAKEKGLKIIEINNNIFDYSIKGHRRFYSCAVEDFLALMRDAAYVVTNSFHGTVFSLIYQRPFYAVKSKSRNSRIVDLLSRIGLEERILEMEQNIGELMLTEIRYDIVNNKLGAFICESKEFLEKALEKK